MTSAGGGVKVRRRVRLELCRRVRTARWKSHLRTADAVVASKLGLVFALVALGGAAEALQPLTIVRVDYLANIPMTDRNVFPAVFPLVERDYWSLPVPVEVVTYRRTDTIGVRITVYNSNAVPTLGTFVFNDAKYAWREIEYALGSYTQSITVPALGTADVTVTLNGMPNFVADGTFFANVDIVPTSGAFMDSSLWERIFLTEALPTGLQAVPWLEVLSDACSWAGGQAGGQAAVARDVTFGLYWSLVFVYYGYAPQYYSADVVDGQVVYLLKKLFEDRASPPLLWAYGDCQAVSGYLHIALASVGLGSALEKEWPTGRSGLWTNPICPIGSGGSAPPANYASTAWVFHQVALFNGNVYDSCAAQVYDLSGAVYANPPSAWSPNGYWQTPNPSWPGPPGAPYRFWGLVDGYMVVDESFDPPQVYPVPSQVVGRTAQNAPIDVLWPGGG